MIQGQNATSVRGSASARSRLRFNLFFWLGLWLAPVVVQGLEQWPEVSVDQCLYWLRQGVVFTLGMSALAEMCGARRRFFYLAAGLIMWGGAVLSILFVATTGITENAYTALTGIIYSGRDGAGLRYLLISWQDMLGVVAASTPFPLLYWHWNRLDWPASTTVFAMATAFCVVITVGRWMLHDYGDVRPFGASKFDTIGLILNPAQPIAAYATLRRTLPLAKELMLEPDRTAPIVRQVDRRRAMTLIVVVGESTARSHMSLYGYCRDTTPELLARAPELFLFNNAISEIPMTVFALSSAFRVPLDQQHGQPDQSVFDVFNAAGFHSYWLSNQFDYPGDPVSTLTKRAQHQIVTYRAKKNQGRDGSTYDGELLSALDRVLDSDPASKIIFLHTVGTHSEYVERTPSDFAQGAFLESPLNRDTTQTETINAYDRAVRYVDYIIAKTIDSAVGHPGDAAVVYFSDHGDEVFARISFVGHRYPRATQDMVEIPLLVWLSPSLRMEQPSLVDDLNAGASLKLDERDVSPLLLDLAGIQVQGLAEQRRPLGGSFRPRQRLMGDKDYDQDPAMGIRPLLPVLRCMTGK